MTTFAGGAGSDIGSTGGWKDGIGAEAEFGNPYAEWADSDNLYVVEIQNQTVREISFSTAAVITIAGEPAIMGFDDGPASTARFSPWFVWGDGNDLYVTESLGDIRRVRISDGQVTTFAAWRLCRSSPLRLPTVWAQQRDSVLRRAYGVTDPVCTSLTGREL
jgi:hypothetical protein